MTMVVASFSLPLIAINAMFAAVTCWHVVFKVKEHRARVDGGMIVLSFAISAVLTPFILDGSDTTLAGKNMLFITGTICFSSLLAVLVVIVIKNHLACKNDPDRKARDTYDAFLATLGSKSGLARDNSRKALHVVVSASLAAIHGISFVAGNALKAMDVFQDLGVSWSGAARGITLLVLWGFSYMISLQDFARLDAFHCIPSWGRRWLSASLEEKEHASFTAAVPFLLGHVPLLLAPLPVFFSVSFSASLGDAAASFIGKRWGKRKMRSDGRKTWAGVAAGTIVTLACTMAWTGAWNPPPATIPFSITWAAIFGLADAANEGTIDDNFVNTFLLGAAAWMLHAWLVPAT